MSQKRKFDAASEADDQRNVQIEKKKKRQRILAELDTDLTEKVIAIKKSPDGVNTTRSGRIINSRVTSLPPTPHRLTKPRNKRKVHKIYSLHYCKLNPFLRLILCRQETNSNNSIIDKLIKLTKQGLNQHQFQAMPLSSENHDQNKNTAAEPICCDVAKTKQISTINDNSNADDEDDDADDASNETIDKNIENDSIISDVEKQLPVNLVTVFEPLIETIDLTDESDIFELTDESDAVDAVIMDVDTIIAAEPSNTFTEIIDSNSDLIVETTNSDDHLLVETALNTNESSIMELDHDSFVKPISDLNSAIIFNQEMNNNLNEYQVGDLVWAAAAGFRFWPAFICNSPDYENECYLKDNKFHVRFLFDGRTGWINSKNSILPYKGINDFNDRCASHCQNIKSRKSELKKEKKKWDTSNNRRWNLAIHEANVLQCIDRTNRVSAYDTILLEWIFLNEKKIKDDQRRTNKRCDSPRTIDTAYSSMKPVSPASLSPSLNELNEKYDVRANIENYLHSMDESTPVYEDSLISYSSVSETTTLSTESSSNLTVDAIFDRLNQQTICNKNELLTGLQTLWQTLYKNEMTSTPTTIAALNRKRTISLDSVNSDSTGSNRKPTRRQLMIAMKEQIRRESASQREISIEPKPKKIREDGEAKKLELIRTFQEEVEECFLKRHPANYLLKGLPKDPICEYCLQANNVFKCAGNCNGYFHAACMDAPVDGLEKMYKHISQKRKCRRSILDDTLNRTTIVQYDKCLQCRNTENQNCFVCHQTDDTCIKCNDKLCPNRYHEKCLEFWPKPEKSYNTDSKCNDSMCSRHICHTCNKLQNIVSMKNLMKCLLCPATYHRTSFCIPAGCKLLSESQLICLRHYSNGTSGDVKQINVDFCLICSKGGALVCCDECPFAFHTECLLNISIGDQYICEGCESGRRPLYGEIVWAKYSSSPWWPAIIVPTPRIPVKNVLDKQKNDHQVCVLFFGTHNYGWVSPRHIYLYDKDDTIFTLCKQNEKHEALRMAIEEAGKAMEIKIRLDGDIKCAPKPYRKIQTNRWLVKQQTTEEMAICSCTPQNPCSMDNGCHNYVTYIECDPETCPAKEYCQNQNFRCGRKFRTETRLTGANERGFGLYALEKIPENSLIVEYVGEVIDTVEKERRFHSYIQNKQDNFYILSLVGNSLFIDAGPCGNEARFINHSCDPNAFSKKWIVQHQNRIGIFAIRDIEEGEEITFTYDWGKGLPDEQKTICLCGSKKCRGFM